MEHYLKKPHQMLLARNLKHLAEMRKKIWNSTSIVFKETKFKYVFLNSSRKGEITFWKGELTNSLLCWKTVMHISWSMEFRPFEGENKKTNKRSLFFLEHFGKQHGAKNWCFLLFTSHHLSFLSFRPSFRVSVCSTFFILSLNFHRL